MVHCNRASPSNKEAKKGLALPKEGLSSRKTEFSFGYALSQCTDAAPKEVHWWPSGRAN